MSSVDSNLTTASTQYSYTPSNTQAWDAIPCPHCGGPQLFRVGISSQTPFVKWLRCPICLLGTVVNESEMSPGPKPLRVPRGLPEIDAVIWAEVRSCLAVGSNAAAVMLCRKLLFHVAVAHAMPPKTDNDRAPSFYAAVEHLQEQQFITAKMRPWVDRIKDIGNDANHELSPITTEQAADVATFTLQLLVLAYEMDAIMADPGAAGIAESSSTEH
jgi:hypothetical protein